MGTHAGGRYARLRGTSDNLDDIVPGYRALDHVLPHKTALERHLTARYGELFAAELHVLRYDLTSSNVEGAAPIFSDTRSGSR